MVGQTILIGKTAENSINKGFLDNHRDYSSMGTKSLFY